MRIFITGGSGFLGQRLIARLGGDGHAISALSRSAGSDALLRGLSASPQRGALDDIAAWAAALAGHDVLIHAASPIDVWGERATFEREIVKATIDLHRACGRYGVKRMIYISSESVLQGGAALLDIDEAAPYPRRANSWYGQAKQQAEAALLAASRSDPAAPETLIIRPTFIWGAGDKQLDTIAARVKAGSFVWLDRGKATIEMVHVENVVEAIRLALTGGASGKVYLVTDDRPMAARPFLTALLATRGVNPGAASVPSWLARPLATLVEGIWRLLGRTTAPPISHFQLDFIGLPRRYRIDAIKRDLGYRPVYSFEQGLAEMASAR